jgi:beta-glucanase (GH16 family)
VDWAPDSITWYVDGIQYQRRTPADLNGNQWVYNHPFFLIMNVGGYWPGYPDGSTVMPQTMAVDYVRVSSLGSSSGGTRITGLAGKCLDVAAANSADGTPVQLYDCNGTGAQQWTAPVTARSGPWASVSTSTRDPLPRAPKSSSGPATAPAHSNGPTRPATTW